MAWDDNRVGRYTVLRRWRAATTGQGVGKLYAALRTATGRPALVLTPGAASHYRPSGEFRLRVRGCAGPQPHLSLEVELPPSGAQPVEQLAEALDVLTGALEALEALPEAAAHLCAAPPPRTPSRARAGYWAALGAVAVLACLCLPRTLPAPAPAQEEAPAPASAAQEALSEPVLLPVASLDSQQPAPGGVRLDMPRKPFEGQRTAPCDDGETEVKLSSGARACFIGVRFTAQTCRTKGYEWQGECYLPSIPTPRAPTSTLPGSSPQVPAQPAR